MKEFIRKHLFVIIFSAAGAVGGFLYWRIVGCTTGSCPIKSNWYLMTLWGLAFGYLSGSILSEMIEKFKARKNSSD